MSFFGNLFGSSETTERKEFWKILESDEDLEKAKKSSFEKKVVIFKHSTRCFISKTVLKNFEKEIEESGKDYIFYFLDLIQFRAVSNKIEDDFSIRHESPQIIVLENGKAIQNASHQSISLNSV